MARIHSALPSACLSRFLPLLTSGAGDRANQRQRQRSSAGAARRERDRDHNRHRVARSTVSDETGSFALPNLPLVPIAWKWRCPDSDLRADRYRAADSMPTRSSAPSCSSWSSRRPSRWRANASMIRNAHTEHQPGDRERSAFWELPLKGRQVRIWSRLARRRAGRACRAIRACREA